MSVAAARPYGGVDAESRRADRRARLMDAGLELLGTEGLAATTVRGVCHKARLTRRYFYESFVNVDALVGAIYDDIVADLTRRGLEAVEAAPADARSKVRAAITTAVEIAVDDPRKGRLLLIEATSSPALMRRRLDGTSLVARLVGDQARAFYRTPATADRSIDLAAYFLVGGFAEAVIAWLDGSLKTTREALIDECTELFLAAGAASRHAV